MVYTKYRMKTCKVNQGLKNVTIQKSTYAIKFIILQRCYDLPIQQNNLCDCDRNILVKWHDTRHGYSTFKATTLALYLPRAEEQAILNQTCILPWRIVSPHELGLQKTLLFALCFATFPTKISPWWYSAGKKKKRICLSSTIEHHPVAMPQEV